MEKTKFECSLLTIMALVTLFNFTSVPSAHATYSLPPDRSITWQDNVGLAFCSNPSYYTQTTCTGAGGTWQTDIPARITTCATLTAGNGDMTAAIKNAINACPAGQTVLLGPGTFNVSSPILMKTGVTLRGAGKGVTTLNATSASTFIIALMAQNMPDYTFSTATPVSITVGNTKGSTNITTGSAHGFQVGQVIQIDQLADPTGNPVIDETLGEGCTYCSRSNGTRPLGQIVRVLTVPTTTTATVEIPLYWTYNLAKSPQAFYGKGPWIKQAGIEDLTIDAHNVMSSLDSNYGTVMMWFADNCWLKNVEVYGESKTGIYPFAAYRCLVRGCEVHKSLNYTSNNGYGSWIYSSSANVFENNYFHDLTVGLTYNGITGGNVFAYNYFTDMKSTDYVYVNRPAVPAHGAHSMMNLFEGNYFDGPLISADLYHGTSSHNTFFRNRVVPDANKIKTRDSVFIWSGQTYYNFIGNVFGTTGVETSYQMSTCDDQSTVPTIYCFDFKGSFAASQSAASTALRHANWDSVSVNNGVVWNGSDDRVLPASLYLNSKPSWWGSLSWPCIGPDLNPMYPGVPVSGGTPWGSGSLPITTFTSFTIIN